MVNVNSVNRRRYFEADGTVKPEALKENPWLVYLLSADRPYVNPERLESVENLNGNPVLDYVMRTLDILDERCRLEDRSYGLIRTVLCWSEVAKAGSETDRKRWRRRGYPLEIHNEASAMIYADHCCVRNPETDPVYVLIGTHGLAGQYIRGECRIGDSIAVSGIAGKISDSVSGFADIIRLLNECIIRAVDDEIWESVKEKIDDFAVNIYPEPKLIGYSVQERLQALLPACGEPDVKTMAFFAGNIFPRYSLWYFEAALSPFGFGGAKTICETVLKKTEGMDSVRHISFKPLADAMYYDYESRRHVNVYRQRIIERYLENPEQFDKHVGLEVTVSDVFATVGVRFTPVCEKMIEFCVEAERSGILSYGKCITMLFDTFGFRRDAFDRLNNENKYLDTMNSARESTKLSILDFIRGDSVTDVGSGGGVLLDEMEKRFPDMSITGTDISENVIRALEAKKREEGHSWSVVKHNFVEGPLSEKTDNIVFSSILHEIYSYTDGPDGKFDRKTVKKALANAVASLNPGGRIIIRDGVKTWRSREMKIVFRTREGFDFFLEFVKSFRGMDRDISPSGKWRNMDPAEKSVITDINYGREFLYTYTWGPESFPHEVQECFGYFTIGDFREFFENTEDMFVIKADSFLEPGYREHLKDLVEIFEVLPDGTEKEMDFPHSNCIVVAEKKPANIVE